MRINPPLLTLWIAPVLVQIVFLAFVFQFFWAAYQHLQVVESSWSRVLKAQGLMRTSERSLIDFAVKSMPQNKELSKQTDAANEQLPSMWDLLSAPKEPKLSPITNAVVLNIYTDDFLVRIVQGKKASMVDLDEIDEFSFGQFSNEWISAHERFLRMRSKAIRQQENFLAEFQKNILYALIILVIAISLSFYFFWKQIVCRFSERLGIIIGHAEMLRKGKLLPLPDGPRDELKKVEQAFHESSDILAQGGRNELAIMNQTSDIICAFDADLHFKSISQQGAKSWQFSANELEKRSVGRLFEPSKSRNYLNEFESAKAEPGGKHSFESIIKCKYGTVKHFVWTVTWSFEDSTFYCIAHDVTPLRKMQQLKEDLFNMIAHDLRAPLASMGLALSHLRWKCSEAENSEQAEMIDKIQSKHEQLMDLVNAILDVRRLEAGKDSLNLECLSAFDFCQQAIEKYTHVADAHKLIVPDPRSDAAVYADASKFKQIIQIMLLTAYELAESGSTVESIVSTENEMVTIKILWTCKAAVLTDLEELFDSNTGRTMSTHGTSALPVEEHMSSSFGFPKQQHSLTNKRVRLDNIKLFVATTLAKVHGGSLGFDLKENQKASLFVCLPEFTDEMDGML